ncbi:ATP-binding protein [Rhizobacter sp. Root404]|uniref:ATP-binding protein n=1 Tax=Rhizobacter sp. Root404 TaxID=1736528 RepID=UPI0006F5BDFD|nr:ATP-binding protein [Rhizobacter sp. Root404]KQW37820.1 histidine kinase [Rhizobacter sp. Root404]
MNAAARAWRRLRHSLRARLTLLFLLLALAMTLIFMGGMQAVMRSGWLELARPLIADYVDRLAAEIGTPPDVAKAEAITRRLPLRIRIEGPVVNWSSRPGEIDDARRDRHRHDADRTPSPWRPVRELADGHRIRFGLASLPRDDAPEDRARLIGWATLLAMLVLVAVAYLWVRALLRPLADIRAGAIRYGAGDFSQPIPARTPDELGELARQVNGMADGLHGLLDAKRELLLAISHELRSPLTRARLNAELVDEGAARDALLRDLGEMRDLITDLLESERLTAGHAALHTEPADLNALVREVVAQSFADRAPRLALAADLPALAADATRIRLLLRNLLDNALRHSAGDALPPVVTTAFDSDSVTLQVRDHGPGVDEAQLPLLAQAFYRPDSARRRATGGVGLGLYLCRLVAQAHGGSMSLRNAHPGLQIDVTLPRRGS